MKKRGSHNCFGKMVFGLLALCLCLSATGVLPVSAEETDAYFCFDTHHADSEMVGERPGNVRYLTEGSYFLKQMDERYGLDPYTMPDTTGLDDLNISGSAQFSENTFAGLAEDLKARSAGKQIYIIDLRQESHYLLNGYPVSWYSGRNDANKGKSLEEIRADEEERFGTLSGSTVSVYSERGRTKENVLDLDITDCKSEQELVESEDFVYMRFPVTDFSWPEPEVLDSFIDFVKGIDMDDSWLHFHCKAGHGRTGIFMAVYDMMKNPDVPLEDIVLRQAMTGGRYLLWERSSDSTDSTHHHSDLDSTAQRTRQVYQYIQENRDSDYAVSWSEWLAS